MKQWMITALLATLLSMASADDNTNRIGEYTASSTILELMGAEQARSFEDKIPVNTPVRWEIYVPEHYDPAKPAGVLVFINSKNSGKILDEWKAIMDRHNLIWIGANESGNDISIPQRVAYAILAPKLINTHYTINPERVYLSGFSGGGRMASMVATEYNSIFKGAIYNSGANFWGESALTRYQEMSNNHYVFVAGTEDFNLEDTKQVYNAYLEAGVKNSKLIVVPNMPHKRPDADILDTAINYLDSRATE